MPDDETLMDERECRVNTHSTHANERDKCQKEIQRMQHAIHCQLLLLPLQAFSGEMYEDFAPCTTILDSPAMRCALIRHTIRPSNQITYHNTAYVLLVQ